MCVFQDVYGESLPALGPHHHSQPYYGYGYGGGLMPRYRARDQSRSLDEGRASAGGGSGGGRRLSDASGSDELGGIGGGGGEEKQQRLSTSMAEVYP